MGVCFQPNLERSLVNDVKNKVITEEEANTIRAAVVGADDHDDKDGPGKGDGKLTEAEWKLYTEKTAINKTTTSYVTKLFQAAGSISCKDIKIKDPAE